MYEIKSIKDGTYGAYEYSTPIPADYSFKQMLAMARDIANANGYEASIYDDENEMIITISPTSNPSRELIVSKSPAYWGGVWSSARTCI